MVGKVCFAGLGCGIDINFYAAPWLRNAGTWDGGCCLGGAVAARVERVRDAMEEVELVLLICRPAWHSIRLPPSSKPISCLVMGRELAGGPHFLRQGARTKQYCSSIGRPSSTAVTNRCCYVVRSSCSRGLTEHGHGLTLDTQFLRVCSCASCCHSLSSPRQDEQEGRKEGQQEEDVSLRLLRLVHQVYCVPGIEKCLTSRHSCDRYRYGRGYPCGRWL